MAPRQPAPTVFVSTSSAVVMPSKEDREKTRNRGGNKTQYDLSNLAVNASIVIIGRKARQLATTITTANKRENKNFVLDEKGKPVMEAVIGPDNKPVKGDDGKPVMQEKIKHFFAFDCNPETDPEKADCRIWRDI